MSHWLCREDATPAAAFVKRMCIAAGVEPVLEANEKPSDRARLQLSSNHGRAVVLQGLARTSVGADCGKEGPGAKLHA